MLFTLIFQFKKGEIDESAVKEKLMPFVGGSGAIGGVLHKESGQIYSFAEALELRLIKRSVAIEFMQGIYQFHPNCILIIFKLKSPQEGL